MIMDTEEYVRVIKQNLQANYVGADGGAILYYEKVNPHILLTILEDTEALVMEGVNKGYIHPSETRMQENTCASPHWLPI